MPLEGKVTKAATFTGATLKLGSSGAAVLALQKRLNELRRLEGKPPIKEDRDFGAETEKAVREFQAAHMEDLKRVSQENGASKFYGVDGKVRFETGGALDRIIQEREEKQAAQKAEDSILNDMLAKEGPDYGKAVPSWAGAPEPSGTRAEGETTDKAPADMPDRDRRRVPAGIVADVKARQDKRQGDAEIIRQAAERKGEEVTAHRRTVEDLKDFANRGANLPGQPAVEPADISPPDFGVINAPAKGAAGPGDIMKMMDALGKKAANRSVTPTIVDDDAGPLSSGATKEEALKAALEAMADQRRRRGMTIVEAVGR